ncbi:LIM domain containing preferred translocation partner in lipoma [Columba livia]|uniref:LIM domain containing preferred translocation partner in lipoma n=1 Tax=Columba livia TaxID=8932 RepID=A0A2I0LU34_COLLI|nr:LIM domain containing preferred translocation partner in lipoma [Columba livia]
MSHPSWLPPKSTNEPVGHVTARMETTHTFGTPSISVSTQQTPKKFAPVVAPKPKYNPYKQPGGDGDFLPPPPPPVDDLGNITSSQGAFPPPPPLDDMTFNVQVNPGGKTLEERRSSLDAEIDSLTSILADLESSSPYKPRTQQGSGTLSSSATTTPSVSTPVTGHKRMIIPNQPPLTATKKSTAKAPGQPAPIPSTWKVEPAYPTSNTVGQAPPGLYQPSGTKKTYITDPVLAPQPPTMQQKSGYPSSGPASSTPAFRPEDELEHLTKKMLYDMENPPSDDYFGRCARCGENVVGEGTGCTAMDQVFHVECFTCMMCNNKLRGQPFYAVEKKAYCEPCYINTLEQCSVCAKPIMERILRATGKAYHPHCFTCVMCHRSLDGIPFTVDAGGNIHCIEDFHKKFAPRCSVCKEPIMPAPGQEETVRIVALDRDFHVQCYRCEDCGGLLSEGDNQGCYPLDGHILCKTCNSARIQALTAKASTDL